jgi:hypothetical protein
MKNKQETINKKLSLKLLKHGLFVLSTVAYSVAQQQRIRIPKTQRKMEAGERCLFNLCY